MPMAPFIGWTRIEYWWVIVAAVGIEAAAIHWLFAVDWGRAARLSLVVNLVTAGIGAVAYPFLGMFLYPVLAPAVLGLSSGGLLVEAGVALVFVALFDWLVELALLALIFGLALRWYRALGFLVTNVATAALLYGALWYAQYIPPLKEDELARIESVYAEEIALVREAAEDMPGHGYYGYPWIDHAWRAAWVSRAEALEFYDLGFGIRVSPSRFHVMYVNDLHGGGWSVTARTQGDAVMIERLTRDTFPDAVYRYQVVRDVPGARDEPRPGEDPASVAVVGVFKAP